MLLIMFKDTAGGTYGAKELKQGRRMRIVLFYSSVVSFNYFTDHIAQELKRRNHEVFILDIRNPSDEDLHSYLHFEQFIAQKVDMVICFDGFGLKDDLFIQLWNEKKVTTVNILMDHPLRFHPTMTKHPDRYIQFCCDRNHVEYVRKYFSDEVLHVEFLPHAGTYVLDSPARPFSERKFDVLFSGSYFRPERKLLEIERDFPEGTVMNQFYKMMAEHLLTHSTVTVEQAVVDMINQTGMQVSGQQLKTIFRCAEPIDGMIRMFQRERVIKAVAESGVDLWLIGNGWEEHPSIGCSNVHRLEDLIPYEQTLHYMADAKINLNVMPWFKAGTHDRIFNILLQHSLPLTDTSSWIEENYTDGEELVIYDLEHLEKLPVIMNTLLENPTRSEEIIQKGYEKTRRNFTWVNCVNQILEACVHVV